MQRRGAARFFLGRLVLSLLSCSFFAVLFFLCKERTKETPDKTVRESDVSALLAMPCRAGVPGWAVMYDYDLAAREIPCRPSVPGGGRMHGLAVGAAYRSPGPSHLYCDISVQPRAPLHCTPFPGIPQGGGLPPLWKCSAASTFRVGWELGLAAEVACRPPGGFSPAAGFPGGALFSPLVPGDTRQGRCF